MAREGRETPKPLPARSSPAHSARVGFFFCLMPLPPEKATPHAFAAPGVFAAWGGVDYARRKRYNRVRISASLKPCLFVSQSHAPRTHVWPDPCSLPCHNMGGLLFWNHFLKCQTEITATFAACQYSVFIERSYSLNKNRELHTCAGSRLRPHYTTISQPCQAFSTTRMNCASSILSNQSRRGLPV